MKSLTINMKNGVVENPQKKIFMLNGNVDAISDITIEIPYKILKKYNLFKSPTERSMLSDDLIFDIDDLKGELITFAQASDSTRFNPFNKEFELVKAFITKVIVQVYRNELIETEDDMKLVVESLPVRVGLSKSILGDFISIRLHSEESPFLEQITLPFGMYEMLTQKPNVPGGIYIFAAENGRGKSTTLGAALLSFAEIHGGLVVTIENPAEMNLHGFIGNNGRCIQTEVSTKHRSFGKAVKEAARQFHASGGGTVLIGEIRDPESAKAAIDFANRGLRVLTTIHARTIPEVITNILGNISAIKGSNINIARDTLANTLRFVVCQELEIHNGNGQWGKRKVTGKMLYNPIGHKNHKLSNALKLESLKGLENLISEQESLLFNAFTDYSGTANIGSKNRYEAIVDIPKKMLEKRTNSFKHQFLNKINKIGE